MPLKDSIEDLIRVVIVDDDDDDRFIFSDCIRYIRKPVSLAVAKDSTSLFTLLQQPPLPHLIFLDINLPGASGIECLRQLKADTTYSQLPVIMYSVSTAAKDIEQAYEDGAHHYIVKPQSYLHLQEALRKLFVPDWQSPQPRPKRPHFLL
jgi:CheY-like chemotaxis protein